MGLYQCLLVASVAVAHANLFSDNQSSLNSFKVKGIVPQIIPEVPETELFMSFGVGDYVAKLGNEIPSRYTHILPLRTWSNMLPYYLYTLVCFDPDFPQFLFSNETQYLTDLVVNVANGDIGNGDRLAPYVAAFPLPGSGYHRYVCLVYRQRDRVSITVDLLNRYPRNPSNFSITEFVKRFNLGTPVAGNFYRARLSLCDLYGQTNNPCTASCRSS